MSPHLTSTLTQPRSPPLISQPFRFKSKRPHSRSPSPSTSHPSSTRSQKSSRRQNHRHHHRRPRRSCQSHESSASNPTPLQDPDTAFRESLFDALADDEGAAFWEGVYGQPIHTYSPYRPNPENPAPGAPSELERMTDGEYTAYVRAKMWERSHGYIVEERKRREEERARKKLGERERERGLREREECEGRVREALGKPERRWKGVWKGYVKGWEDLRVCAETAAATTSAAAEGCLDTEHARFEPRGWKENAIPWPTWSGKLKNVSRETVEEFLRKAPQPETEGTEVDLLAVVKAERVRWHPDKMQQRYGGMGLDDGMRKGVTSVFQIVDRMWGEMRGKVPSVVAEKERQASREH